MRLVESGGEGDTYGYRIVRLEYERFLSSKKLKIINYKIYKHISKVLLYIIFHAYIFFLIKIYNCFNALSISNVIDTIHFYNNPVTYNINIDVD